MGEGLNQKTEQKEIYEISVLDTTRRSVLQRLTEGKRIVFVVYEGKIIISPDSLHTTLTTYLGIRENNDTYIMGECDTTSLNSFRYLVNVAKKVKGKESNISNKPEGINIKTQFLNWLGI